MSDVAFIYRAVLLCFHQTSMLGKNAMCNNYLILHVLKFWHSVNHKWWWVSSRVSFNDFLPEAIAALDWPSEFWGEYHFGEFLAFPNPENIMWRTLAPLQRVKYFHLEEFSHVDAWGLGEDVIILAKVKQEAELIFVCLFSASYVLVPICEAEKRDMIKRGNRLIA